MVAENHKQTHWLAVHWHNIKGQAPKIMAENHKQAHWKQIMSRKPQAAQKQHCTKM
jgi:hypothetical protein